MTFEDALTFDKFWDDLSVHGSETIEKVSQFFLPSNRSSTIFPVFLSDDTNSYVSFFTYWLKKHGCVVALKAIARDSNGVIVHTFWQPFTSVTAERIYIRSLPYFKDFNGKGFCGTIELEFYTKTQPLFRYPGVSMFYESKKHVAVVHGCIRSYNLDEAPADYAIPLPQTGFDINLGKNFKNYICFVAGGAVSYSLRLTLHSDKNVDVKTVQIEQSVYGQLHLLILEDIFSDRSLSGRVRCTIDHNLDVFPRFYAGTLTNNSYPTLTHSFFDTSEQTLRKYSILGSQNRAKNIASDLYYDSAFIVPVLSLSEFLTEIQTYGQNLNFTGEIDIRSLGSDGSVLSEEVQFAPVVSKWNEMHIFSINALLERYCLVDQPASVFFGFRSQGVAFPSRFKLGLNVAKFKKYNFGANICFAPSVQDKTLLNKPITRRWFPIGGPSNFIGTIHLTSFEIAPQQVPKEISLEFYNYLGQRLDRVLITNNNGTLYFDLLEDDELSNFFGGTMGWCFASCATYLLDSYFFATAVDLIGGDHAF